MKRWSIVLAILSSTGCSNKEVIKPTIKLDAASGYCQFLADTLKVKFKMRDPERIEYVCSLQVDEHTESLYDGEALRGAARILKYKENIKYRPAFRDCFLKKKCDNDKGFEGRESCYIECANKTGYKLFGE